jgi:hypothetical protein
VAREVGTEFNPAFQGPIEKLRAAAEAQGIHTHFISGVRSSEDQRQLYANFLAGRAGKPLPYLDRGPVPLAAKPGMSLHEKGLAADLVADDPSQQARLRAMAPQYGLMTLGAKDPNHFQLAASQPVGTTVNAASAPVAGALSKPAAAASLYGSPFLDSLAKIESNNQNIFSGVDKDYPGQPGSRSQGYFQIDTPTWQQFAVQAGIDITKYPSAMNAPPEVQAQVAQLIPLSRFGKRTQDMLIKQYGALDTKATIGELSAKVGGATAPSGGTAVAAAPAAPAADQPWWSKFVTPPTDAQGKSVEGAKSPLEQAVATVTGGPSEKAKAALEAAAPKGGGLESIGPGVRNMSPGLAPGAVQQVWGQTLNSFLQPLTWGSAAPGSGGVGPVAGFRQPPPPGLSLTSVPFDPSGSQFQGFG